MQANARDAVATARGYSLDAIGGEAAVAARHGGSARGDARYSASVDAPGQQENCGGGGADQEDGGRGGPGHVAGAARSRAQGTTAMRWSPRLFKLASKNPMPTYSWHSNRWASVVPYWRNSE